MMTSTAVPALLLASLLAAPLSAQWPADTAVNLLVAVKPAGQVTPRVATTSDGGCYVAWLDQASGSDAVYLQKLNADGFREWPGAGLLVSGKAGGPPDLIVADDDSAVLVFKDKIDALPAVPGFFAHRVDRFREKTWGANGVRLTNDGPDERPHVVQASDGDFVFAWARLDAPTGSVRLQRLAPDGTPEFPANGKIVYGALSEQPAYVDLAASDAGRVILVWMRDALIPREVLTQQFDSSGAPVWGSAPLTVYDLGDTPFFQGPGLLSDGAGGAILWWQRAGGLLVPADDVRVQHVDADGSERFAHDGVSVSTDTTSDHRDPAVAYLPASDAIQVFWLQATPDEGPAGVSGQRFSPTGAPLWGEPGTVLIPMDALVRRELQALPAGDGALVSLVEETGGAASESVVTLRVDADGEAVWPGSPLAASSLLSGKAALQVAATPGGGEILAWQDDRNGTQDVYAQLVNLDGSFGADTPWADLGNALAGTNGKPRFTGSGPLTGGSTTSLLLVNALPGSGASLLLGLSVLGAPFKGGVLVPAPDAVLGPVPTGAGFLELTFAWPAGLPSRLSLVSQAWIPDPGASAGFAASNGLGGTTP